MKKIVSMLLIAATTFLLGGRDEARAEYPFDKPITIIVPFGPGGAVDIASRIISDYFQKNYKITVNVVNKPGGGQAIGINEMLRTRPDGYTFCFPSISGVTTMPILSEVGYTSKDLKAVAQISVMELVFSTPKGGAPTLAGFMEAATKDPESTVYASTGAITTQRLYFTHLLHRFHNDLKVRHAAYGSGHEVSTALLGKHVSAGFQVPTNILPYLKTGDVTSVAITRNTRRADMPNTPTFRELYADKLTPADESWIDIGSWHGLVASKRVPDKVINTFIPLLEKALQDPEVIEKFSKVGLSIDYLPPKEFDVIIQGSADFVKAVLNGRTSLD